MHHAFALGQPMFASAGSATRGMATTTIVTATTRLDDEKIFIRARPRSNPGTGGGVVDWEVG